MTPEERASLESITTIARQLGQRGDSLYNIGSGAYADAVKYFQALTKGNRGQITAAVAPTAELMREQGEGARAGIQAGLGRGGGRDLALSKVGQQTQGAIAGLTAGVQPGAATQLGQLGGQGVGQGLESSGAAVGAHGLVQSALTKARQFEEGLGESSRQFGAGLAENSRQFGTGLAEQSRQFGAGLAEQVRQGNMSWEQANRAMVLQERMFSSEFQLKVDGFTEGMRQFNAWLQIQREQIAAGRSAASGAGWGSAIGAAGAIGAALI
jgi:hypothetical protein